MNEPIYRCSSCGQWLHFGVNCDLCAAVRDVERWESSSTAADS